MRSQLRSIYIQIWRKWISIHLSFIIYNFREKNITLSCNAKAFLEKLSFIVLLILLRPPPTCPWDMLFILRFSSGETDIEGEEAFMVCAAEFDSVIKLLPTTFPPLSPLINHTIWSTGVGKGYPFSSRYLTKIYYQEVTVEFTTTDANIYIISKEIKKHGKFKGTLINVFS